MSGFMPTLEGFAKGALATAATVTTIGAGLIYYGQNYLIYPSAYVSLGPEADVILKPSEFGLHHEELDLKTSDGVLLRCYLLKQKKELSRPTKFETIHITPINYDNAESDHDFMARRPTIVMFHGNGGNLGHRLPLGMMFQLTMRCNVLMVSYRGYGNSEGTPSEKGFRIDAQTALDFLTSDQRFSKTPIFLFGQSIGGAVSIDLASRNPAKIHALILENTFTSLPELVPHVLPLLSSFTFLCHQKWESAVKAPKLPPSLPVLLLSGLSDTLVPPSHMKALRDCFQQRGPKAAANTHFEEFPGGEHNDTCNHPGYWSIVNEFITKVTRAYISAL